MEMCVIKYNPDWQKHTPFLQCYETAIGGSHGVPGGAAEDCAKKTGLDITTAIACTKNKVESTALVQETARKTCALQPEHQFTPWAVLNGAVCGADGTGCHGLLKHVCDLYAGPKPAGCK